MDPLVSAMPIALVVGGLSFRIFICSAAGTWGKGEIQSSHRSIRLAPLSPAILRAVSGGGTDSGVPPRAGQPVRSPAAGPKNEITVWGQYEVRILLLRRNQGPRNAEPRYVHEAVRSVAKRVSAILRSELRLIGRGRRESH
jgi:hypothetical protein